MDVLRLMSENNPTELIGKYFDFDIIKLVLNSFKLIGVYKLQMLNFFNIFIESGIMVHQLLFFLLFDWLVNCY